MTDTTVTEASSEVAARKVFGLVETEFRDLSQWMLEYPEPAYEVFKASERLNSFLGVTASR